MRVALINTLYTPFGAGGAGRSVQELAEDLVELGHPVLVVSLAPRSWNGEPDPPRGVAIKRVESDSSFRPFARNAKPLSVPMKAVWHARESAHPVLESRLRNLLDEFGADVVHTNNIAGFGLAAWAAAKERPLVHTMHDYYLLCARSQMYKDEALCASQCTSCKVLRLPARHARSRPDLFVGVSQATVDIHRKFGAIRPNEHTTVVHNWPRATSLPRESTTGEVHTFGLLGRVGTDKGTWVALDAFARFRAAGHHTAQLHIAGQATGADLHRIEEFCRTTPGAHYLGQEVLSSEFYANVDTVLVPSQWYEPFGRVAAEALQSGCHVIASDIGGLPEAVEQFGGGLMVTNFSDPSSWVTKMEEAQTSATRSPIVVGSRTSVAERYLRLYDSALAKKRDDPDSAKTPTDEQ